MKYLKLYEDWDDSKSKDLLNSLKQLSHEMGRLKTMSSLYRRQKTPNELIEDYFLELKEIEKFYITVHRNTDSIGPIEFLLQKMIDIDSIESEFYRYVPKLESLRNRLETIEKFQCHFKISINGKDQSKYNDKDYKYNIYEYQGIGDRKFGYDENGVCYSDGSHGQKFPDDKVSLRVQFLLI